MNLSRRTRILGVQLVAISFFTLFLQCTRGAPPGPPREIVGAEEWEKTGKYLDSYWLGVGDKTGWVYVFPCWKRNKVKFRVRKDYEIENVLRFEIYHSYAGLGMGTSLRSHFPMLLKVRDGDVFPLFQHVYRIDYNRVAKLTRVTDQIPEEFRPANMSRTFSTVEIGPTVFSEGTRQFQEYDMVKLLSFNGGMKPVAKFELVPYVVRSTDPAKRKRLSFAASKGDIISTRGHEYEVLNVVPTQTIKGVGRLVGWIELSGDPVDKEKKGAERTVSPEESGIRDPE